VETELRAPRPEKVAVVDEVRERIGAASATILTEYRGLSVSDLQVLRRALAQAGGEYRIYKNSLVRRAIEARGLEGFDDLLTGPTALAFVSGDVSSVAKALKDFARSNPHLVVKGALVGEGLFDAAQTSAIADLPSKDVLLAQIAGMFAAPMQRFAGLLAALPQRFAYALSALIDERGGPPAESEPESSAEQAAVEEGPSASDAGASVAEEASVEQTPAAAAEETEAAVGESADEPPAASSDDSAVAEATTETSEASATEPSASPDEPAEGAAEGPDESPDESPPAGDN